MSRKPNLEKITEPDEGLVHYCPPFGFDQVTLCGLTDFICAEESGEPTDKPVNCKMCKGIVAYIHQHRKPRNAETWWIAPLEE